MTHEEAPEPVGVSLWFVRAIHGRVNLLHKKWHVSTPYSANDDSTPSTVTELSCQICCPQRLLFAAAATFNQPARNVVAKMARNTGRDGSQTDREHAQVKWLMPRTGMGRLSLAQKSPHHREIARNLLGVLFVCPQLYVATAPPPLTSRSPPSAAKHDGHP